jgi:hypothetical protein
MSNTVRPQYQFDIHEVRDSKRSDSSHGNSQPHTVDKSLKSKVGTYVPVGGMKNYEMCITKEQISPPRKGSLASECSSEDRMRPSAVTARHTSKDTVASVQGKSRKGRRYHDVNKSDVLTPNSPRRYQEYF